MTSIGTNSAQVTLSGRELALQRRQAMALRGKAGVASSGASRLAAGSRLRPAMACTATSAPTPALGSGSALPPSPQPTAARQRRQALSQSGKSALGAKPTASRPVGQVRPATALAADGGCACQTSEASASSAVQSASDSASAFGPTGAAKAAMDRSLSGRDVAKQRRSVRATVGRQDASAPASRTRGPQAHLQANQASWPAPAPGVLTQTASHATPGVSGDAQTKVTGSHKGVSEAVTGTAFLSLDQFTSIMGKKPPSTGTPSTPSTPSPSTRRGSVMPSQGAHQASGQDLPRASKVTGNESGAARELTGSAYFNTQDFAQPTRASTPAKVGSVQTLAGSWVTGTEVGRSQKVTGDARGACHAVTGTDYLSAQQLQAVCETTPAVQPVRKVGQDMTWKQQSITGARVGRSKQVTGDEYGACAPISGTAYIGTQQYQGFCAPEQLQAQQALSRHEGSICAAVVTGDRPGAGGLGTTGDRRGACEPISGTPYIGADNWPQQCAASARFVQPQRPSKDPHPSPTASDFSIHPPSRQARERSSNAVTGSALSGQRITGAANKGLGLITGTPEFRHRDNPPTLGPAAASSGPVAHAPSAAHKLTGEGSQSGVPISGAAWQTSGRVTGTEGTSSLARNPSQRGELREMGMTAKNFRKTERAQQPQSKVTGSAGNTTSGACVTLSGGARG